VKLDVLVGGEPVDALAMICHREQSYERGRELVSRLRKLIPRQMFEVPIQAAIGSRVIARETVAAMRKTFWPNATAATFRVSASCSKNKKKENAA